MLIAHDPGHGCDPNVTGTTAGGLVERDWVLCMAHELMHGVTSAQHTILRSGSVGAPYSERAMAAARQKADLVLCHHVNAGPSGLRGLMTFVDPSDDLGLAVGAAIMRASPHALLRQKLTAEPARAGSWTKDAWGVVRNYRELGLPTVLVEWGFATHRVDAELLQAPSSRPALCAAGAAGIARAIELLAPDASCG